MESYTVICHANDGLYRNIWSGYISGLAGSIMSNIYGPRGLYVVICDCLSNNRPSLHHKLK